MLEHQQRLKTAEDSVGLTPVENSIFRNFYWSFHHSQGIPSLQTLIQLYTARQYSPEIVGDLSVLQIRVGAAVERLQIPTMHTQEVYDPKSQKYTPLSQNKALTLSEGFRPRWLKNISIIDIVFKTSHNPSDIKGYDDELVRESKLSNDHLISKILTLVTYTDWRYQINVRPNRINGADPHESFLKSYSFDNKPLQSPEYDKQYKGMREMLEILGISQIRNGSYPSSEELLIKGKQFNLPDEEIINLMTNFTQLIYQWDKNHHPQKFLAS